MDLENQENIHAIRLWLDEELTKEFLLQFRENMDMANLDLQSAVAESDFHKASQLFGYIQGIRECLAPPEAMIDSIRAGGNEVSTTG